MYKGKNGIIGAVMLVEGLPCIVTASHIFSGVGETVTVDGKEVAVTSILKEFDLALIELPSDCMTELTGFGKAAVLENALLTNYRHVIKCRVLSAGASLIYLGFPCSEMPQGGDSGSPILQEGKVIGLISSMLLSSCMGIAISSDILCKMSGYHK